MTKRSDPMNEGKRRPVWTQSHGAMGKARIWSKITPFHKEPSQVPVEKPKKCCHWLIDCRPLSINPSSLFLVEDRYGMIIPKFRRRRK
jgi:hypothetical protein